MKGNINNERNMPQRRSLHVCRYVRTHTHTHTHTHTENEGINNEGNMRQLRGLKAMLHLTDDGKDKPATEVMWKLTPEPTVYLKIYAWLKIKQRNCADFRPHRTGYGNWRLNNNNMAKLGAWLSTAFFKEKCACDPSSLSPDDRGTDMHARSRSRPLPLSLPPTSLVHLPCVWIWCSPHATRASTLGLPERRDTDLDRLCAERLPCPFAEQAHVRVAGEKVRWPLLHDSLGDVGGSGYDPG